MTYSIKSTSSFSFPFPSPFKNNFSFLFLILAPFRLPNWNEMCSGAGYSPLYPETWKLLWNEMEPVRIPANGSFHFLSLLFYIPLKTIHAVFFVSLILCFSSKSCLCSVVTISHGAEHVHLHFTSQYIYSSRGGNEMGKLGRLKVFYYASESTFSSLKRESDSEIMGEWKELGEEMIF